MLRLQLLDDRQHIVVGCVKELSAADFKSRRYQHLEIYEAVDLSTEPISLLPSPNVGRTSYLNAVVEEMVRKTGGKVTKTIYGTAPSSGGWKRHPTKRTIQVWPKNFIFPAMSHLTIQRVTDVTNPERILVRFQVEEVLNPRGDGFKKDLLRCINLLLENAGNADVFPLEFNEAEQLRRSYGTIDWELLPNGTCEDVTKTVIRKLRQPTPALRKQVTNRLAAIDELKPERRFQGRGHFTSYLAAQFTQNLVVFENLRLGAIYVMHTDWETLSKLSRSELLSSHRDKFIRILHQPGWEQRLGKLIHEARGENDEPQTRLL
jgi:hypothetical protein